MVRKSKLVVELRTAKPRLLENGGGDRRLRKAKGQGKREVQRVSSDALSSPPSTNTSISCRSSSRATTCTTANSSVAQTKVAQHSHRSGTVHELEPIYADAQSDDEET